MSGDLHFRAAARFGAEGVAMALLAGFSPYGWLASIAAVFVALDYLLCAASLIAWRQSEGLR